MKKMLNIFNKLKKNDTVKIKYDSSIGKGKEFQTFVVTSPKKTVGKKGVERVIMKHVDNPTGVKYTLYNRDGSVSLAIGDMAASMTDIKESVEQVDEYIKKDGGRKRCAGGDGRRTDVDVDEAKQGELQQWKFPNERKANQFLKDIENAGVAQGDLMQKNTKQVTIEILPGSPKVIDSAIAKYSKKNGGERFNQGSSGPFESVETISKDEQKLLDFINKNW